MGGGEGGRRQRGVPEEYTPQDYLFPELYVDGIKGPREVEVDTARLVYRRRPEGRGVRLGLAPYEQAWQLVIDPVEAKATRTALVLIPWEGYRGILLLPGDELELIEARGTQVSHVSREGREVRERSVLAYILTGKGETRTLRAQTRGTVALIAWYPGEHSDRYVYVIVKNPRWVQPEE